MIQRPLFLALSLLTPAVSAGTLHEALISAYRNSAGIRSSEAQVRVMSETVRQAEARRLPHLTATAGSGRHSDDTVSYNVFGPPSSGSESYRVRTWQLNLTQPLYRGGALLAGIEKTKADTATQEAVLALTVQSVLLNAATAYIDTLRTRADLEVTQENVRVLSEQKNVVERTLARQDLTVVDLDQAISRLEDARAQYHQAAGQHHSALTNYQRWIGHAPAELVTPSPLTNLPASREEAIRLAESASHAVRQVSLAEQSARADIDIAIAPTLPTVSLSANLSNEEDWQASSRGTTRNYSFMIQVNFPLYQGGAPAAQVRRSQEVHKQRKLQVEQARDLARQAAANAWDARSSAQADLDARQVQSKAAGLALEGLQRQQARGNRTVLDVLNGHQEWLNAQLAENKARRDLAVSEYRILAAIGRLSLEELPLPGALSVAPDGIATRHWTDFNVGPRTK